MVLLGPGLSALDAGQFYFEQTRRLILVAALLANGILAVIFAIIYRRKLRQKS